MIDIKMVLKSDESIEKAAEEYAKDISSQKLDLTDFVEQLGSGLTSTDVEDRVKATKCLSDTLKNLPFDLLNETQLNFIGTFYCDRLKDHHSVLPNTLTGILAIVSMVHVPEGTASRILHAMFQNVPCQSQVRSDREKVFEILKKLSETKTQELLAMGSDFVYGVINAMDGERDPRILLSLYEFIPTFVNTFPLGHLTEDMFEVIACYFPIDFNPSATDPKAITRDLLASRLVDCLCAREEFAENSINLLIEKLDSQLNVAKLDSLMLLSKCAEKFTPKSIDQHFSDIWKVLKTELLPGTSQEVTIPALDALESIIASTSCDDSVCRNILKEILDTILISLSDVNGRMFIPATAIALKCAAPSKRSAAVVTAQCLPSLLSQIHTDTEELQVQQTTLIELTAQLIYICIQTEAVKDFDATVIDNAQAEFVSVITNTNSHVKLVNAGFSALAACASIVSEVNRNKVYQAINQILITVKTISIDEEDIADIDIIPVLSAFATAHPDEVLAQIVSPLLTRNYFTQELSLGTTSGIFEALRGLVHIRKFRDVILSFFFKIIFDGVDGDSVVKEPRLNVRLIGLRALRHLLENDDNEQLAEELFAQYNVFERLLTLIHSNVLSTVIPDVVVEKTVDDGLYEISQILRLVVRSLSVDNQQLVIAKYLPAINLSLKSDLYFTTGLLGYLEQTVDLEDHFDHLVDELTKLSLNNDDEEITNMSNHLLCSLFNKCPDNDHHRSVLRKAIDLIKHEITNHNKKAVEVLSWISKGLLVRGHTDAAELIDSLIDLLEHPTLANAAAAAFEIISIEFPQLHLPVIKHLFKQKLFQIVLKKVWAKIETVSEHHLSALVFVFKLTPHQVLCNNITKVGPILLKCLDLNRPKPLLAALEICRRFVASQDDFFRDHLQNIVPQCLKLTTFPNSMQVRIAAIQCLTSISKYPTFTILPFAQDVQIGLTPALDDKKRLVRNATVEARNQWFIVGSPK